VPSKLHAARASKFRQAPTGCCHEISKVDPSLQPRFATLTSDHTFHPAVLVFGVQKIFQFSPWMFVLIHCRARSLVLRVAFDPGAGK
jgi:hypothetical protein